MKKKDAGIQSALAESAARSRRLEAINGLLFMSPFFILMLVFFINIIVNGLIFSFKEAHGVDVGGFIGLANYHTVFSDNWFWLTARISFGMALACLVTQIPISFMMANWLNSLPFKKIQALLQAAFFVPYLMSAVVIGGLFNMLFGGDPGFINWLLSQLHLPHHLEWIRNRSLSFWVVVITSFWQMAGFQTAYFLTNLQTINPELYEAAKIDGASHLQVMLHIKLPLMRPAFSFIMVLSVISSLTIYELVFMLFPYGIGGIPTILTYMIGGAFWGDMNLGATTAAGVIFFIIILIISLFQIRVLGLGKPHED